MTTDGWLLLVAGIATHLAMMHAFHDSYIAGALTASGVNLVGALLLSQHDSREDG